MSNRIEKMAENVSGRADSIMEKLLDLGTSIGQKEHKIIHDFNTKFEWDPTASMILGKLILSNPDSKSKKIFGNRLWKEFVKMVDIEPTHVYDNDGKIADTYFSYKKKLDQLTALQELGFTVELMTDVNYHSEAAEVNKLFVKYVNGMPSATDEE